MLKYRRLTRQERYQIEILMKRGDGVRAIARALNRAPSSISRELRRNSDSLSKDIYWAAAAETRTSMNRHRSRPDLHRIPRGSRAAALIYDLMAKDWSPEQISGRLRQEKAQLTISYSTIYRFVYREWLYGQPLWRKLRKPRYKRMPKKLRKDSLLRGQIRNRTSIENRPKIIELRKRKGDFERDVIQGGDAGPVILSIVDRVSRLTRLELLPKRTSQGVHEATVRMLKSDRHLRSITNDNGKEFGRHEETQKSLGRPIFFAHPHHPWERGTNENTNGLVRQYFPRRKNFAGVTPEQVKAAESLLNERPRKCLGFKTPLEVHHGQRSVLLRWM